MATYYAAWGSPVLPAAAPRNEFGVQPAVAGSHVAAANVTAPAPAATAQKNRLTRRMYDSEFNTKMQAINNTYRTALETARVVFETSKKTARDNRQAAIDALKASYSQ